MVKPFFVAIDGPAGAGKSTVSQEVARRLNLQYLDTGAMYRAITWKALQLNVNLEDDNFLKKLIENTKIQIKGKQKNLIIVDGTDVTTKIRTPEINNNVSIVAKLPVVRSALVELQRKVAIDAGRIIMEGRDIGTKVLPDAHIKLFLTASLDERCRRRLKDFKDMNIKTDIQALKKELALRDKIDSERKDSPLMQAEDAFLIDTTNISFNEVVDKIVEIIENHKDFKKQDSKDE